MNNLFDTTLNEILQQAEYGIITVENIAYEQIYIKGCGWCHFTLSAEARREFAEGIAGAIWRAPKEHQINGILNKKLSGKWFAHRLTYNGKRYEYCAGQDYPSEIKSIQRFINNL